MSKCIKFEDMISAYIDGELSAAEEAELTAHLEVCPSCRDLLAVYRNLQELVTENAVEPPAELLSNVMAGISGLNISKPNYRKRLKRVSVRYLAVAACIAVAVMAVPQILGGSHFSEPAYTDAEVYASSSQMDTGAVSDEAEAGEDTFIISSAAGSQPDSQEGFTAGADAASADNADSAAAENAPATADSKAVIAGNAPAAGSGTSVIKSHVRRFRSGHRRSLLQPQLCKPIR